MIFFENDPASKMLKHRPEDLAAHAKLVASIGGLPSEKGKSDSKTLLIK
jgi:hypothetical protein